jgi:TonB family protein
MQYPKSILAAAALTIVVPAMALAADVKVIANSSVTASTISVRDLKSVFLGEKSSLDGSHVVPVFEKGGSAHEAFLKEFLGRSDDDLQRYYQTLVFSGRGSMPKAVGSDAEVVAYVATTRGAIGYVSAETSAEGVKTLTVGDSAANAERKLLSRVEPEYPQALRDRSIGGTVRLRLTIAANGNVENAELLGGSPILGVAAMAAAAKWKYSPAGSRTTAEVSILFDPQH